LLELRHYMVAARILRDNARALPAAAAANAQEAHREGLRKLCNALLGRLAEFPAAPLDEDGASKNLAEQLLCCDVAIANETLSVDELTARILDRSDALAAEILGALCLEK